MLIKLKENMQFRSYDGESEFYIKKYDYYRNGEKIWCAITEMEMYPLTEIYLDDYMPKINGKWINEKNEYIK